jgi:hypothetical protein
MRHDDQPRPGAQSSPDPRWVDLTILFRRDDRHVDFVLGLPHSQWPQHGVVFELRRHDMITRLERPMNREVQAIGSVEREHDLLRRSGIPESSQGRPANSDALIQLRGSSRVASPRCDAAAGQILGHRPCDRLRLGKAGRGVVEINASFRIHGDITQRGRGITKGRGVVPA